MGRQRDIIVSFDDIQITRGRKSRNEALRSGLSYVVVSNPDSSDIIARRISDDTDRSTPFQIKEDNPKVEKNDRKIKTPSSSFRVDVRVKNYIEDALIFIDKDGKEFSSRLKKGKIKKDQLLNDSENVSEDGKGLYCVNCGIFLTSIDPLEHVMDDLDIPKQIKPQLLKELKGYGTKFTEVKIGS